MSSLWRRILGGEGSEEDPFPWVPLQEPAQLDAILREDTTKIKVIFKHSTRCGISAMMLRRFERNWKAHVAKTDFYLLDLIARRDLSDKVSERLQFRHESPQVLLLRGTQIVQTASHGRISSLLPTEI
jgi:bacillithiol system protein YtxJ